MIERALFAVIPPIPITHTPSGTSLANAEKIKQELANAQAKAQEILNQANVQANKFIEEARQSAAKVLEQESQKAMATANDGWVRWVPILKMFRQKVIGPPTRPITSVTIDSAETLAGRVRPRTRKFLQGPHNIWP